MMVAHYTIASAVRWAPQNPPGPPPAMTESFDVASRPPNNPAGQSLEGTRLLQAAAGATPAWTSTASGGGATADRGNTHILALRPGVGNAITITTPPGTQTNDVMVAAIGFRPNTLAVATPAGWTFVRRMNNPNGDANSLAIYIKVATAAEPATHTWVYTTTPINVENGQCTPPPACAAATLSHATPSVTTTVANTMIVTAHTFGSSATWTPPAGMTESYDRASLATPNANGQSIEGNRVGQGAIGATGVKTATAAGPLAVADRGNTHILALHPAPPPPPIPGGFNAYEPSTPPGAITGVIKTKISGSPLTVDLIALNAARTAILTTFFGTVTVELLNAADNSGVLGPVTQCRGSWTPIAGASGSLVFTLADNGRKAFSITENNAWRDVRVRVTYAGPPVVVGCSNDNFAIRPSALTVSAADATWTTPGGARALDNIGTSGGTVHKAGYAFRVTAAAQPATATQYDGIPTIVSATCLTLAGMSGCNTGIFTLPGGAAWSGAGARINDSATYDEAGALSLLLEDQGFASVDAADSTLVERTIPQAGGAVNVGRFVPDNFVVAPNNVPSFQTFGSACASRSFTYVGQPFGYVTTPQALVTARNAAGGTTTNYRESLWKITTALPSDVSQTYGNGGVGPAIDTTLATNAPAVVSLNNGTGTVTVSNLDRIFYTRSLTTPDALYNAAISLTISVRDDSEADGQITTSTATPFGAIAFDSGNEFRYGRLRLQNSNGSEFLAMPIPILTQYWNGTAFFTNAADNCTAIAVGNVALGNYQGNLNAGETAVTVGGAFAAGIGLLRLSAPGAGNNGSVDVSVNLTAVPAGASCTPGMPASAGSGLTHLQGAWCGTNFDDDPSARATFGVYRNSDRFIYQRENP